MPESPETDLSLIEKEAKKLIMQFTERGSSQEFKVNIVPIAFGLKAVEILFVMDEKKGSTEELEKQISAIRGVASAETTDVRRAVG